MADLTNPFIGVWGVRGGATLPDGSVSADQNDMPEWASLIRPDYFIGPRPQPERSTPPRTEAEYCASAAAVGAKAILYAPDSTVGASKFPGFGGWMNRDEAEFKETPQAFVDRFDKLKGRGLVLGQFT